MCGCETFIKYVCSAECIQDHPQDVTKKIKTKKTKQKSRLTHMKTGIRKAEKSFCTLVLVTCVPSLIFFPMEINGIIINNCHLSLQGIASTDG